MNRSQPSSFRTRARRSPSYSARRWSGAHAFMSWTVRAADGSGSVEFAKSSGVMPARSASAHRMLVQAAFGIGRNSTRCRGSTTVCVSTWAAKGGSRTEARLRERRAELANFS